jgi:hypothetical protein
MKRRGATIIVVFLTPAHPIKCVASRIMHRAPVIQTVKQTDQLFRKRYIEGVMVMQQLTHVAYSLMCIEHIINIV